MTNMLIDAKTMAQKRQVCKNKIQDVHKTNKWL